MKEMIIYHGSKSIIQQPIYGVGKAYNDYGLGFYCTQSLDLAMEWAVEENRDGYANKYALDLQGLEILNLSDKSFNTLHWITLLLQNRTFSLKSDIVKIGKEYLIDNFALPTKDFDVIRGYRADDSYFAYAESFLNNTISVQRLSEALRLGNLGEQVVLMTPKAFERVKFLGYEVADSNVYYPLRRIRNDKARMEFLSDRKGRAVADELYLNDIIRGIKADDKRLQ